MHIARIPIWQIKRAPYNPRVALKPGDAGYEALKRSIAKEHAVSPQLLERYHQQTEHAEKT